MALSFPTESGFPFLFTYDTPLAMKVQGSVQASADPQISQGDKLHTPESLQLKSNLTLSLTYKLQSHISFITPFDHQQYIAGFDKLVHMHMPIQSDIRVNVQSMQGKIEIKPIINQHNPILHYSTWPYTSQVDITNFQPVSLQSSTHGFNQKNLHIYEKVFGERETGVAIRIQIQHKRQSLSFASIKDVYSKHGPFSALKGLWDDASIHYSWFNIDVLPEQSTTHKIALQFGYHYDYTSNSKSDKLFTFSETQQQRQQTITNKVSSGIHNVATKIIDTEIKFQGNKNIDYMITAAFAKSNIDPKSRFLVYFRKNASDDSFEVSLDAQNEVYNTNELDPEYSMWIKPKVKSTIEVIYGPTLQLASNLSAHFQFSRSDGRKQYLKERPMYKQCEHEMYKGDKHLPPCANITMEANCLDRIDIKLLFEKLPPQVEQVMKTVFDTLRFNYYLVSEVDVQQRTSPNQINMKVRFDPDLRAVNVSVITPEEQTTFHNIEVSEYAKQIFVLHPVFHLRSRLVSKVLELPYYRPFSVVDKTQISTFNNKIYPTHLSTHWVVMFLYLPNEARQLDSSFTVGQQLEYQPEQYTILVRQNEKDSQMKDVKIVLSSPQTEFRVVEIDMKPNKSGQFWQPVTIDDQFISLSDQESYDYKDGYIQIYGLFNREVKVEIRDAFYVIYDGRRLVLRVAENKFRNSVRGFSGQYNDEPTQEFFTPHGCVTSNWHKFFKSYELESEEGEQVRQEFISKDQKKCVKTRRPLYTDVISDEATRRSEYAFQGSSGKCTKYRTQYVEQNGDICFSIYVVPVCSNECQPKGTITKNVPVHCIQKNSVAKLWKNQIDRGANPDFSHKKESKTVSMQLPQRCSV